MVKIIQDKEKCIGCGSCVAICPEHWEMSSEGKANLKGSKLNPQTGNHQLEKEEIPCDQEAVEICPVQCIRLIK